MEPIEAQVEELWDFLRSLHINASPPGRKVADRASYDLPAVGREELGCFENKRSCTASSFAHGDLRGDEPTARLLELA